MGLIQLFKKNLYGIAESVKLGLYGSKIKSVQGNIDPTLRVVTSTDDEIQFWLNDESTYTRIRALDFRSIDTNVFGTYIVDHEITTGSGLPGGAVANDYALVTSNWTTYLVNELYQYNGTVWNQIDLEHGKKIAIRKIGGLTGYIENVLYHYSTGTATWIQVGIVSTLGPAPDGTFGGPRGNISGVTSSDLTAGAFDKVETIIGQLSYGATKRRKYQILFSQNGLQVLDSIPANYHIEKVTVVVITSFDGAADSTDIDLGGTTLITLDNTELVAGEIYEIVVEDEDVAAVALEANNTFTLSTTGEFYVIVDYRGQD